MNENDIEISGNIYPTMVVYRYNLFYKFMCTTSRDIIRYYSTVASEDPVYYFIYPEKSTYCKIRNGSRLMISYTYISNVGLFPEIRLASKANFYDGTL